MTRAPKPPTTDQLASLVSRSCRLLRDRCSLYLHHHTPKARAAKETSVNRRWARLQRDAVRLGLPHDSP